MWQGLIAMIVAAALLAIGILVEPDANEPAPTHSVSSVVSDEFEWSEFHADAMQEYADEFTALFNSYQVKRAKNGRLMIRQGDSGSFKFVKKGQ